MRYRFKCATPYTLNGRRFKKGDITDDQDMAISLHYLFEEAVETQEEVTTAMSKRDLQKVAEQLKIDVVKSWTKRQLIDNINKFQRNE